MFWKIVLVLGILGVLLGFAVTGISVALPIAADGRTSWNEAALGIVPGALFLILLFFVFRIGLISLSRIGRGLTDRRRCRTDNNL